MEKDCINHCLNWRGIPNKSEACSGCNGSGIKTYGSTLTWRAGEGGFGGQMLTNDVCDICWGTGSRRTKGTDLKKLFFLLDKLEKQIKDLS